MGNWQHLQHRLIRCQDPDIGDGNNLSKLTDTWLRDILLSSRVPRLRPALLCHVSRVDTSVNAHDWLLIDYLKIKWMNKNIFCHPSTPRKVPGIYMKMSSNLCCSDHETVIRNQQSVSVPIRVIRAFANNIRIAHKNTISQSHLFHPRQFEIDLLTKSKPI